MEPTLTEEPAQVASSQAEYRIPPEFEPDISHIITEDNEPVDNIFSERQQRFLAQTLHSSWKTPQPFVALANVGLFYGLRKPPLVPDMLLSLDVEPNKGIPNLNLSEKRNRSYFVWEYGKPPDLVVEIVSNLKGGELDEKMLLYAEIGIDFYVVFDPFQEYGTPTLRAFALVSGEYLPLPEARFNRLGLSLQFWHGTFEGFDDDWIRWFTTDGVMLPSAEELDAALEDTRKHLEETTKYREIAEVVALQERDRANAEQDRANTERDRAEAERTRAEALAEKLRALGINPDEL
jgi:Uma2 family endonuclease